MKGIDISAWQPNVDWQAVKESGIEFAIIKLGESNRVDSMFVDHINNATSNGIKVGIYLYSHATSIDEAVAEADFVDEQLKTYLNGKNPEMGIWFDMEDPSIESSGTNITELCGNFVNRLNEIGYTYVGVYSSYNWLTNGNIDTSQLADYVPYWCAQYNSECNFENKNLKIWQYADNVSIGGVNYDGNEYY